MEIPEIGEWKIDRNESRVDFPISTAPLLQSQCGFPALALPPPLDVLRFCYSLFSIYHFPFSALDRPVKGRGDSPTLWSQ